MLNKSQHYSTQSPTKLILERNSMLEYNLRFALTHGSLSKKKLFQLLKNEQDYQRRIQINKLDNQTSFSSLKKSLDNRQFNRKISPEQAKEENQDTNYLLTSRNFIVNQVGEWKDSQSERCRIEMQMSPENSSESFELRSDAISCLCEELTRSSISSM